MVEVRLRPLKICHILSPTMRLGIVLTPDVWVNGWPNFDWYALIQNNRICIYIHTWSRYTTHYNGLNWVKTVIPHVPGSVYVGFSLCKYSTARNCLVLVSIHVASLG